MGVTEVVRGADLLASTPRHGLLYRPLGLEAPAFYHFPLLGSDGQRLSKRNADAGLDTLGERYTAPEILGKLAYLAGFNPSAEPRSGESLLEDFAWERVPRADIPHSGGTVFEKEAAQADSLCRFFSCFVPKGRLESPLLPSAPG